MSKQAPISFIPGFSIGQPGQELPPMAPGITRLETTLHVLGEPVFSIWFTVGTDYFAGLDDEGRAALIDGVHAAAVANCVQCNTVIAEEIFEQEFSAAA